MEIAVKPGPGSRGLAAGTGRPAWRVRAEGFLVGGSRAGSGLAILLVLVAILGVAATIALPNLISQRVEQDIIKEQQTVKQLTAAFESFVIRTQIIPGTNDWAAAVAAAAGLELTAVRQVYPAFPADANTRRILLIDPAFTPAAVSSGLLYTQALAGIAAGSANAPGSATRAMIVSSTHRGLALPVGEGVPAATLFSNLWHWSYQPASKSPPAGFSAAWTGQANHLHLGRLSLANLFHQVALTNVQLRLGSVPVLPGELSGLASGLGSTGPALDFATPAQRLYLRGTHLQVSSRAGVMYANHVVNRDAVFSLETSLGPLFHFRFAEASGAVAANAGSAGAAADMVLWFAPGLNRVGPRPPTFPGYSATNAAIEFVGADFGTSASRLPASFAGFTLAGWINPTADLGAQGGIMGQRQVVAIESKNKNFITITTQYGGSLDVAWSFANGTWHHLAATGDGTSLKFYLDGSLAGTAAGATTDYGNAASTYYFGVGGLGSGKKDFSKMLVDEVVFYDRPLSAADVLLLYGGSLP